MPGKKNFGILKKLEIVRHEFTNLLSQHILWT